MSNLKFLPIGVDSPFLNEETGELLPQHIHLNLQSNTVKLIRGNVEEEPLDQESTIVWEIPSEVSPVGWYRLVQSSVFKGFLDDLIATYNNPEIASLGKLWESWHTTWYKFIVGAYLEHFFTENDYFQRCEIEKWDSEKIDAGLLELDCSSIGHIAEIISQQAYLNGVLIQGDINQYLKEEYDKVVEQANRFCFGVIERKNAKVELLAFFDENIASKFLKSEYLNPVKTIDASFYKTVIDLIFSNPGRIQLYHLIQAIKNPVKM